MENNLKVCPNCNTVNESEAIFCRQCGNKLEMQEPIAEETTEVLPVSENNEEATSESQNIFRVPDNSSSDSQQIPFDTNGVSEAEFEAYVGKNQQNFIPAFAKFCGGGKVSFSPLVFLLSWLVSPIAGAFWFFHRKINKIGAVVLSIAVALSVASGVVGACMVNDMAGIVGVLVKNEINGSYYDYGEFDEYYEYDGFDEYDFQQNSYSPVAEFYSDDEFNQYIDEYMDEFSDDEVYSQFNEELLNQYLKDLFNIVSKYSAISSLLGLLNLAFAIVLGLYAKYFYFKDAAAKILAIKQKNPTPSSINDIALAGSTSPALWIVLLVAYIVISIVYAAVLVGSMISQIMTFI